MNDLKRGQDMVRGELEQDTVALSEVKENLSDVKENVNELVRSFQTFSVTVNKDIMCIRGIIDKTFDIVVDSRYKDGIQHIEAAYRVFIKGGGRDLQPYIFELQTKAAVSLDPARIREYLSIIHKKENLQTCQNVGEYIFLILGQYLQIMVHFYISEERVDMVTQQFEEFNQHFREIESVFKEVTGVDFVFGQKFMDVDKQDMASLLCGDVVTPDESHQ